MTVAPADSALTRRGADVAPLSSQQESIWVAQTAHPEAATYNVPLMLTPDGLLDLTALRAALDSLVVRHEILRTRYDVRDGRPVQIIQAPQPVDLQVYAADGADPEGQALDIATRPFALDEMPPLRCAVWTGLENGDRLLLCLHHIAIDGWSVPLLLDELWAGYDAARSGRAIAIPAPALQYADYAYWERDVLHPSDRHQKLLAQRVDRLRDLPPRIRLGRLSAAPSAGHPAGRLSFTLPAGVSEGVRHVALQLRVTPYVVLLAAFEETVRRWSGENRFVLATAMVNRPFSALERVLGCFVSTAPLRCEVRGEDSFGELCRGVRQEFTDLLRCQSVPGEQIAAQLPGVAWNQIGFIVLNTSTSPGQTPISDLVLPTGTAMSDLTLLVEPRDAVIATIEYDTGHYTGAVVQRIADTLRMVLTAAVAAPDTVLARLPVASSADPHPGVFVGPPVDLLADHLSRTTGKDSA